MNANSRLFLRKFIQDPKHVGSMVPSSKFLASSLVASVPWHETDSVAELGAGTGAITQYISNKVRSDTKVYLFEKDETMRERLQLDFPAFSCHSDVQDMRRALGPSGEQLDCILSGLPFFNFSRELRERLMGEILRALKPGGLFVLFQYSLQMKGRLTESFAIERIKFVPFNFPPAFVYVCRKI